MTPDCYKWATQPSTPSLLISAIVFMFTSKSWSCSKILWSCQRWMMYQKHLVIQHWTSRGVSIAMGLVCWEGAEMSGRKWWITCQFSYNWLKHTSQTQPDFGSALQLQKITLRDLPIPLMENPRMCFFHSIIKSLLLLLHRMVQTIACLYNTGVVTVHYDLYATKKNLIVTKRALSSMPW